MPITKSAIKANRQNLKRKTQNLVKKRAISDVKKKLRVALSAKETDKIAELLRSLYKAVDKAVKTNAVKKGTGNRIKSRLSRVYSQRKSSKSTQAPQGEKV